MEIRKYKEDDISTMIRIWNKVVEDGVAFPQEECLDEESGKKFFAEQSYCAVAEDNGSVVGLYILHPNNIGTIPKAFRMKDGSFENICLYYHEL